MLTTENFQPPSTLPKKNSSLHLSHWSAGFIYIYIYNAVQFFLSPLLLFHHISLIGRQNAMHIFMMQYNCVQPPTCCIHILWKCLSTLSACPQRDSKVASRYRYLYLFWLIGERSGGGGGGSIGSWPAMMMVVGVVNGYNNGGSIGCWPLVALMVGDW